MKINIFLGVVLFLFVGMNYGSAGAETKWYHSAEKLDRNIAYVIGKAPNCIFIQMNHGLGIPSNLIMVERASRFHDIDGSFLSLSSLKIPCLGEIRVSKRTDMPDPVLMDLKVLEYDNDASTAFTMKEPFKRLPK